MAGKKSSKYWEKRFVELEKAQNRYGIETYRQIEPVFNKAQMDIQARIASWYARYANSNGISMAEARKQLTAAERKEFQWDVNEYIRYGNENAINQKWMKELENASAKYHIARLEALQVRTQQAMEVAFGKELNAIDEMIRKSYQSGYYHTCFEIQKGFGIGWEIGQIDEKRLAKIIAKPWAPDGKDFSDRIWNSKMQMVGELHRELGRMMIQGKAPDEAIKSMTKYVDRKFRNAKAQAGRLIMTEQAFFSSTAQEDAFNDLGVEEFEVIATLDSHTSQICQEMDGKHFPMTDFNPGVTAPPFHVNCRSTTAPYFEDEFNTPGERATRGEDGRTYYVPDDMKYKEWKKLFVDGDTGEVKDVKPETVSKTEPQKLAKAEPMQIVESVENREYKTLTLEEIKQMTGKCTKDERRIIYGRLRGGYIASGEGKYINADLRNGRTLNEHRQKVTETLRAVIAQNTIDDDIIVHRYVGVHAFEDMTGVELPKRTLRTTKAEYWDMLLKIPAQVKTGRIYDEKAFFSTSGVLGKNVFNGRRILVKMKVPKGLHGYITTNYRESEIIFDRPKIRVIDVEADRADNVMIVNCILEE